MSMTECPGKARITEQGTGTCSSAIREQKKVEARHPLLSFLFYYVNITLENLYLKSNEEKQITVYSKDYPQLIIDNSKLWWPYQMGEPKLHDLTIKVINKNQYYIYNKKIGFREVSNDFDEVGAKKVYKINCKRILLKGAGWILIYF